MNIKIEYGLLNNKLVHIDNVPKGLACNCICPSCKKPLIARKGSNTRHHFAHYKNHQCVTAYETELHMLTKELLKETKTFKIPSVYIGLNNIMISEEVLIPLDNVKLEYKINNIIPDIVVYAGNSILLIEIFVTHKIDAEKLKKIRKLNLSTIQIDLSHIDRHITKDELKNILINTSEYKSWIYNKYQEKKEIEKIADCLQIPIVANCSISSKNIESEHLYIKPCPKVTSKSKSALLKYCLDCPYLFKKSDNYIYCLYEHENYEGQLSFLK